MQVSNLTTIGVILTLLGACGDKVLKGDEVEFANEIHYIVLDKGAFRRELNASIPKLNLPTESAKERFREELFSVQGQIEEALKEEWTSGEDFSVAWDFNYCYFTCGGIYSERILNKRYVETIARTLRRIDPHGVWVYHTVSEIDTNPTSNRWVWDENWQGEFFIRRDICFINGSEMKPKWRSQIGCAD